MIHENPSLIKEEKEKEQKKEKTVAQIEDRQGIKMIENDR